MAESKPNLNDIVKPSNLKPPIMKIDAPIEDTQKEENNEKPASNENDEELNICSPVALTAKTTISNPFQTSPPNENHAKSVLKPPQLSLNSSNNSSSARPFTLNPSKLSFTPKLSDSTKSDANSDKTNSNSTTNGELPKFVPLISKDDEKPSPPTAATQEKTSSTAPAPPPAPTSFVFGENLQERVIAGEGKAADDPKPSTSLNSNGTTEMLFSSAVKSDTAMKNDNGIAKEAKSLSESAREYEESRANKRKYEEVEVKTGEEEETNILSISCKLFAFDNVTSSWQERGRGTLRLNDFEGDEGRTQSRLVFRTTGSLRVVLNTKIWADMTVEQASEKSVRLTALDANAEVRVFLIMASIEVIKMLYTHLQNRLQMEIASQKRKKIEPNNGSA